MPLHHPQIPNIIGEASQALMSAATATGSLKKGETSQSSYEGGATANRPMLFNASWSDEIYGNSSTVQPSSVLLIPCIKI